MKLLVVVAAFGVGLGNLQELSKCVSDSRLQAISEDEVESRLSASNPHKPELKKIYYINMQRSALRRGRITQLLKMTGSGEVPVERFNAYTKDLAKNADLTEFTKLGIHPYMKEVYKGDTMWATVAVYLSHAKLLKKILEENPRSDDMFLILEDDAILNPGWYKTFMEEKLAQVPDDWDMIRIGYGTDSHLRCEDKINQHIYENRGPTRSEKNDMAFYAGNTAYIVRPSSIPKILAGLASFPVLDVDGTMISKEGGARVYGLAEPLVYHGNGLGFSERMSPMNLMKDKITSSLADLIEAPLKKAAAEMAAGPPSAMDKAFDTYSEDLPETASV